MGLGRRCSAPLARRLTRGVHGAFMRSAAAVSEYLLRFGFERVAAADMIDDLAGTFTADYLRAHPDELARMDPLRLDISRDGVIER